MQGDYAKRRLSARTRAERGANAHPLPQEDAEKGSAFGAVRQGALCRLRGPGRAALSLSTEMHRQVKRAKMAVVGTQV